jgi:endonuclease/exonuclease/phosphatase family metal-dependent hydrolase
MPLPSEMTLKIFTYNVQMRDQLDKLKYHNVERARVIAGILARSDYDVLIFQEAFDDDARKEMNKILGPTFKYRTTIVGSDDDIRAQNVLDGGRLLGFIYGAVFLPAWAASLTALAGLAAGAALGWITGKPKSDGGAFMMSRWPIQLQGQTLYKKATGNDRFGKKGVSWALINKQGFYFNVYGTHTQSGSGNDEFATRVSQFKQIRAMYEATAPNWQPALIAGDFNVDYCFDRDLCPEVPPDDDGDGDGPDRPGGGGVRISRPALARDNPPAALTSAAATSCCSQKEREWMLRELGASVPGDLSKYVYTSDAANELKGGGSSTSLDYVLHAQEPRHERDRKILRPQPRRASLVTVKSRGVYAGRERDLSDHYGVLGTYTYPFVREESVNFDGIWKCIKFNDKPDTYKHRLTFNPFGKYVINDFDGHQHSEYVHHIVPGRGTTGKTGENVGKITFRKVPSGTFVEYDYVLSFNPDFLAHFIPTEIETPRRKRVLETRPHVKNALLLRNAQRTMLYAFESWPPVGIGDDFQPGDPV